MRGRSLGLVTTADETSGFGVLFSAEFDGIVRKPHPRQSYAVKFLKYLWTLFFLILVQRHGVIIFISTNQKETGQGAGDLSFFCLFWRRVLPTRTFPWSHVLKACVSVHAFKTSHAHDKQAGKIFCSCWLVKLEAVNKRFGADWLESWFFEIL